MHLSDICLSRTSDLNREQRGLGRLKIGTEVAHVTRLGHHFPDQKVNGQLVADVLNSQHAATAATWRINAKILSTCRGRGVLCHHVHSLLLLLLHCVLASCSAVYCNRSCLWVCDSGRVGGVRTFLQPARAVFVSL